ncbi:hypothetical protein V9T40_000883 [Parthenolecanium corni]|uniref:FHA domain-containing protein n=1 Tax=Parthenolecanium corni TaxID=536013 RepID=A0AAN9TDU7_9HEMI
MEPIETSSEQLASSMNSKRRSSSRFIKRRKFDDELVESSLHATVSTVPSRPGRVRTHSATNPVVDVGSVSNTDPSLPETFIQVEPNPPRNRRLSGKSTSVGSAAGGSSGNRKRKLTKHNLSSCYKDLGRWKPIDDLLLIQGVLQTSDLRAVYQGVKFSCKFTFNEIAQRWYALVYDRNISRLALSAIRNLQAETISQVEANCLYAESEEEVLATLKSTIDPKLSVFEDLLARNRHIFHRGRTPKSLYVHWCMMKQHNLLSDQLGTEKPISIPTMVTTEERNNALLNSFGNVSDTPLQRSENIPSFAECEEFLNDSELLNEVKDSALDKQLSLMDRISKKDIRMLEDELSQIQLASAALPGANSFEFDNGTLAVLRGKCVRYLMRSKEITLGRKTQDNEVDVDLSLEGPAWKISRRQATIRVKNNGEFLIASEGKRPIYVDGTPISTGNKRVINNNSVLEIAGLRFIFLINYEFLNIVIRHDTTKTNPKS